MRMRKNTTSKNASNGKTFTFLTSTRPKKTRASQTKPARRCLFWRFRKRQPRRAGNRHRERRLHHRNRKEKPRRKLFGRRKISNVIIAACEAAEAENIPNLRFLNCGAEYLLKYIPDFSVQKFTWISAVRSPQAPTKTAALPTKTFWTSTKRFSRLAASSAKNRQRGIFDYSLKSFSENGFEVTSVIRDLHNSDFRATSKPNTKNVRPKRPPHLPLGGKAEITAL